MIKGSQAGTALRSGLTNLINPTKQMRIAMDKYNVEVIKNKDGSVNLMETMNNLRANLKDVDQATQAQALATIFGKEAMSGWAAVVNASNKDFEKLTQAISNSEGAANEMAETMQDNLYGSLTTLKSAMEGAAISIGEALLPLIKQLTSWIQGAVDWFNGLDGSTQTLIVSIGLFVAALGPLLLLLGSLITSVTTISGALGALGGVFGVTSSAATVAGGALTGVTGATVGATGAFSGLIGAGTTLSAFLKGGLIVSLVGVIAKIGESSAALSWLQDKFGSLGTIIGGVCEFIAGVWNITFDNILAKATLALDLIAATIDGPGGATIKDAWNNHNKKMEEISNQALDNITLKTTRELSQQKNTVDKETKDASNKANTNTKEMANNIEKNSKQASDSMKKNMSATSKVVFDESGKIPKDVQSNMQKSVQAMRQAGSDIYNGMNTSFSKLASQGKQHFSNLYNGVTRSTSQMASKVIADWNRIRSALRGTITGNVQIKVHGVQSALNQINSVRNAARHRNYMPNKPKPPKRFVSFAAMPRNFTPPNPLVNFAAMPMMPTNSYMRTRDVLRSSDISSFASSQIPSYINVNLGKKENKKKSNGANSQNINVEVKIDKFENKTNNSPNEIADKVIDRVVYKLQREKFAMGGAR